MLTFSQPLTEYLYSVNTKNLRL